MKTEIKKQWLAALRSGEFVQAKEFLSTEKGQCCLGVLCVLAEREGVVTSSDKTDRTAKYEVVHVKEFSNSHDQYWDESTSELPIAVQKWAGLDSANPSVRANLGIVDYDEVEREYPTTLAELNDDYDFKFAEIADLIEAQL